MKEKNLMLKIRALQIIFAFLIVLTGVRAQDFVQASGTDFEINGNTFYFSGANNYYLFYKPLSNVQEVMNDAVSLDLKVIRTWGFCDGTCSDATGYSFQSSPGVYKEATFQKFDRIIKEASDRNLKITIPLVNNWDNFGGMCQYAKWCNVTNASICDADEPWPFGTATQVHDAFYSNSCTKQIYKDYVNYFLNRTNTLTGIKYKDDPTIFAWELANEPRARSDKTGATLNNWIGEMSAYIKSVDSNHMVTPGSDGGYLDKPSNPEWSWWYHGNEGQDFIGNHQWPSVDFTTFRYYPEAGKFDDVNYSLWIKEHIEDAHNVIGKPVVMEEFGSVTNKTGKMSDFYSELESNGANGDTFWLLADSQASGNDGYFVFCPGDAVCSVISDHADYMNSLSSECSEDSQCDNGIYCDGQEVCSAGSCTSGSAIDCSANNLPSVGTCSNNPDNNILTWDFFAGFSSTCDESSDSCTSGSATFTHQCNISNCGAQCAANSDCDDSNPSTVDTCISNCSCQHEFVGNCTVPYGGMNVSSNTVFCPGTYNLAGNSIRLYPGVNITCQGTTLRGNKSQTCINLGGSNGIFGCAIDNCSNAVYGYHHHDNVLENNVITNSTIGLYFHDVQKSVFKNNTFRRCGRAMHLWWGTYYNEFVGNLIESGSMGIYFDWNSGFNNFTGNTFRNNEFVAIHNSQYYGTIYNVSFVGNVIQNNTQGLMIHAASGSVFKDNLFAYNEYPISIGYSSNNTVYHNNFISNVKQISDTNNTENNFVFANYYSVYDEPGEGCFDANSDGICDSPYLIQVNNMDKAPFTSQNGWTNYSVPCDRPESGAYVWGNVKFCPEIYNLQEGIKIDSDNVVIDCNNAKLLGSGIGAGISSQGIFDLEYWGNKTENLKNFSPILDDLRGFVDSMTSFDNITIKNCNVEGFREGINMTSVKNLELLNNTVHGNNDGIFFVAPYGSIKDNKLYSNVNGIIGGGVNSTVENNEVYGSNSGVLVAGIGCNVSGNNIHNNSGTGITVGGFDNFVFNNFASGNSGNDGISLTYSVGAHAFNNIANNNARAGISILEGSNNTVSLNVMNNNKFGFGMQGIFSQGPSEGNLISDNVMVGNTEAGIGLNDGNLWKIGEIIFGSNMKVKGHRVIENNFTINFLNNTADLFVYGREVTNNNFYSNDFYGGGVINPGDNNYCVSNVGNEYYNGAQEAPGDC